MPTHQDHERSTAARAHTAFGRTESAEVLRTPLHRLHYAGLRKEDVDTYTGAPKIPPAVIAGSISVCMTAYNEGLDAYRATLNALARNADHFIHAGEPRIAQNFTICILVDGIDKLSPAFSSYAECLGLYRPEMLDAKADYHLFEALIDRHLLQLSPEELLAHGNFNPISRRESGAWTNLSASMSLQRIMLFIKQDNRGKLDSHRCYFEILCREQRPEFFLQIDVGTVPDDSAVHEMWSYCSSHENVAAVSARSHMPVPSKVTDVLGAWQYADIAAERILLWPIELAMGYMSVLAGQLCLTRAEAVWSAPDATDARETPRVMQNYLRGLSNLGPFESNMFLAEDRILALEIVFQRNSRWELGYVPEANGTIDRCDTWTELLCQRRRWTCSSIACRLWMFTRVMDYVRSANRTPLQKSRIATASMFHLIYFALQWLMPAFALVIFTSLHQLTSAVVTGQVALSGLVDVAYGGLLLLLAAQLWVAARGSVSSRTNRFIRYSIGYQTIYTAAGATIVVAANLTTLQLALPLGLLATMLVGVLLLSKWYSNEIYQGYLKSLPAYLFSRPAVAFMIMTYAALNSNNTSWGTKGLNTPQYVASHSGTSCATNPQHVKRSFDRFRTASVLVMLLANASLFLTASAQGWMTSFTGIAVVLSLLCLQVATAFGARIAVFYVRTMARRGKSNALS